MALPQGIYFREVDDQTDPTNYDAEVSLGPNYPRTSAQGNNVGWEQAIDGTRDRTVTSPVNLGGVHFRGNGGVSDYRIDLPATGGHNVRLAMGDRDSPQESRIELRDTTTVFRALEHGAGDPVPINQWYDATDVLRASASDWNLGNAVEFRTFASTIFRARIGGATGGSGNSVIASVYVEAAVPGAVPSLFITGPAGRW